MKLNKDILLLSGVLAASLGLSSCDKGKPEAADSKASAPAEAAKTAEATVPAGDLVDVTPEYPAPMFVGTPVPRGNISNLEKPDPEAVKARLTFKVPKGAENVAKGKTVTTSDLLPAIGTVDLITDDDKDGADGSYVELAPGHQWVQIDLGAEYDVWKILLWHYHKQDAVYFDVNVQIGNDPEFKAGSYTSVYNNDDDDSSKLGKGTDPTYVETNHGRLIDGKGVKGRYVRFYSNGNTTNEMNHYIEAYVYGTPAK